MSSSGASSPRGAMTPPPGGAQQQPSPLTVGTRFVKEYYKAALTMTTTDDSTENKIFRFYQPSSVLSVGVASQPTQPRVFESLLQEELKDRFSMEGYEDCPIRFEFEHGAIDAQMSVNGGVLLVVTGHIVYLPAGGDEEELYEEAVLAHRRKAFVHTFFLGSMSGAGGKRSYYIHNDILRFLHDDEEKTVVASNTTAAAAADQAAVQLPVAVEEHPVAVEPVVEPEQVAVAPGGGVEEAKETLSEQEDAPEPETVESEEPSPEVMEDAAAHVPSEGGGVEETKEDMEELTKVEKSAGAAAKPAPGSWASLVATGKGTLSNPGTPARSVTKTAKAPAAKKSKAAAAAASPPPNIPVLQPEPTPTSATTATTTTATTTVSPGKTDSSKPRLGKRDPDCTLVIKNIGMSTVEADIRGMFEGYADDTETKVVGCTVSAHRAIAFVDFDSPKPVLAAVEQHDKEKFQLHGRVLDIYQKTLEQRPRRNNQSGGGGGGGGGRGSFRGGGGQPGNGRHPYRRSGSGSGRGGGGGRGGEGRGGGGRAGR